MYQKPGNKTVSKKSTVEEPVMHYQPQQFILSNLSMPESKMSSFDKIEKIHLGLSKKDLENLKKKSGLDYDSLADILSVARVTLINKKGNDKFNSSLSERILSVAEVYSFGYEIFGDVEKFNAWIFAPSQALQGARPYDLLNNQYGREEI